MARYTIILALLAVVAAVSAQDELELKPQTPNSTISCPSNEKWNICGQLCEPSCRNPCPIRELCPAIQCTAKFTGGCRCQDGKVRNNKGKCVSRLQCWSEPKGQTSPQVLP
ncbi:venom peptide CtAPI-like [Calliopsis andreniformis]|uniref:venom peptide CtAPI-like n=1 Tax=Calliopsis andreniformis TaxID=337506 RepID=UPI003FCD50C5